MGHLGHADRGQDCDHYRDDRYADVYPGDLVMRLANLREVSVLDFERQVAQDLCKE